MTWTLHPASQDDEEVVNAFVAACEPSCAAHLGVWRSAMEQTKAESLPSRCWNVVATQTGHLIGSAAFRHERLDKFRLSIVVHPRWGGQGVGDQALAHLERGLRSSNARTVHVRVPDTAAHALRFYERRGFVEMQRMVELRLELSHFDPGTWQPVLQPFGEQGLTFHTMHDELRRNPIFWDQLQALQNAVLPGWPDFDPGSVRLLEGDAFRRQLEELGSLPEGFFVAVHEGQYVGYSGLAQPPSDASGVVDNAGTAVLDAYRNRHLATALKVCCLSYAKEHGYTVAMSRSANPAMIRVNENLGFERQKAEVRLLKRLEP
jgi:GNAT superfamily N-acetyltransferase